MYSSNTGEANLPLNLGRRERLDNGNFQKLVIPKSIRLFGSWQSFSQINGNENDIVDEFFNQGPSHNDLISTGKTNMIERLSVKEVGYLLEYESFNNFTKLFQKNAGIPGELKRKS